MRINRGLIYGAVSQSTNTPIPSTPSKPSSTMNTPGFISHPCTDWPRHKHECIPVNTTSNQQYSMVSTPAPAEQFITVAALFFSPEEERSQIVTVQCRAQGTPSQGMCPFPIVHNYFTESVPSTIILTVGLNGEPLRFPLHIWYCPVALQRGSPVNRGIRRITSGAAGKDWSGPVLVLKFNGSRRQGYTDAGSNDLPALSAYFLSYN
ncbi:hypothetical protein NM688_g2550 [Phlebia brevispora]|uniref:Uncharacterized protein n=1 Tax=Phlebia brevispora TaxID=194682 RepID=A0ACC1T863_9APHY|nr:hypothetical protein NM688_g2550 [Phlebia brevispora]